MSRLASSQRTNIVILRPCLAESRGYNGRQKQYDLLLAQNKEMN